MRPVDEKAWNDFVHFESKEAFHILYSNYFKYLCYIGHKRGLSAESVKDGINDLFLYLWEKRDRLKAVTNPHNYIITAFISKTHKKANIADQEFPAPETYDQMYAEPSLESLYIEIQMQEEVARILKNFIDHLPEKQRQMIYQKFYVGLSYKEISETNKVSINTVYNTIYTAVEKLKLQIGKDNLDQLFLTLVTLGIYFLFF